MKKLMLALAVIVVASAGSYAQCGRQITWSAPKAEQLDALGKVEKVFDKSVEVQTTASTITVKMGEDNDYRLDGDVRDINCNWKEAYKNGKTSFKSLMAKATGEARPADVSIEAKNGNIVILIEIEGMEGRKIRIPVNDYKESK